MAVRKLAKYPVHIHIYMEHMIYSGCVNNG